MKAGDLVKKTGDSLPGHIGVVLEVSENSIGYSFVTVLDESGAVRIWYSELVKVISSIND